MIVVETFIVCDGGCGMTFGVDNRERTGKRHRIEAKQEGWKVVRNKDYCPKCKPK